MREIKNSFVKTSLLGIALVLSGCNSNGTDGLTALVKTTTEPAGANCVDGGMRIDMGLDASRNGILESNEIDNTKYVCNGTDGTNGTNGTDGLTMLITTTTEPAGANCVVGGTRIDVGLDDDRNGTLETAEIDDTTYICNGADGLTGADGLVVLMNTTTEPAGTNCADGGIRINVGLDDDSNGTLESTEIDSTKYVCNGADGATGATGATGTDGLTTLITTTTEPAGANCADGGIRIDVGLDDDRNGTLESAEIDDTQYVCNGADGLSFLTEEEQCLLNAGGYRAITLNDGSIWLDRNLGAASSTDAGGYYQWGRGTDGHENVTSSLAMGPVNTITPNDGFFYINSAYMGDWSSADITLSQRQSLWQSPYDSATNTNQVCPCGYIVPTLTKFHSLSDADRAILALPEGLGLRDENAILQSSTISHYWTSELQPAFFPGEPQFPLIMYVDPYWAGQFAYYTGSGRGTSVGAQIRCVKP